MTPPPSETPAAHLLTDASERTARTRALNDAARAALPFGFAHTLITRGVAALPPDEVAQVLDAVRGYGDFTPDNDPHGEHDFGVLTRVRRDGKADWTATPPSSPSSAVDRETIFWKIDYYAKPREGVPPFTLGSASPWSWEATDRVLTVYLACEH